MGARKIAVLGWKRDLCQLAGNIAFHLGLTDEARWAYYAARAAQHQREREWARLHAEQEDA